MCSMTRNVFTVMTYIDLANIKRLEDIAHRRAHYYIFSGINHSNYITTQIATTSKALTIQPNGMATAEPALAVCVATGAPVPV